MDCIVCCSNRHSFSSNYPIAYREATISLGYYRLVTIAKAPSKQVEYYFASDASAVIEYTNKVIFLEDDDVAAITADGCKYMGASLRLG